MAARVMSIELAVSLACAATLVGCGGNLGFATQEELRAEAIADMEQQANVLARDAYYLIDKSNSQREALEEIDDWAPEVYDTESGGDDNLLWDAVFYAKKSDGGGLFFEDVSLRACVRFHSTLRDPAQITWEPIECPDFVDRLTTRRAYGDTVQLSPNPTPVGTPPE